MKEYIVTFRLHPDPPELDVVVPAENAGGAVKVAVEAMSSYATVRFHKSVKEVIEVPDVHQG
jgi:hypothetical protein